jgi:predicted PolB exonuclease-like 3'-5' exonuclease
LADQSIVVFDLETVPDIDAGRLALGLADSIAAQEVRNALTENYRRDGQKTEQVFIKPVLHKIVCIGAVYANRSGREQPWVISRAGSVHIGQRSESEIIRGFVDSLGEAPAPQLIGFNSSAFDLPVLRYRAFALSVSVPILHKGNGREYWYRFGKDHLDICDVISSFGATARPSLAELGSLLGISVKIGGMDGAQVEPLVADGKIEEVAAYCESDVIATYLMFLRLSLVTGELSSETHQGSLDALKLFMEERLDKRPHFQPYISFLAA